MRRRILAVLAFNVYAIFLLSAFEENTPHLFDSHLHVEDADYAEWGWRDHIEAQISSLKEKNNSAGWGNHYVWRLISGLVVTALVGLLAGAIAKQDGAKVSAIANIPSVLIWAAIIMLSGYIVPEARVGYILISIIAIPLTTYVAYISGKYGEQVQNHYFPEDTVFGVRGYHWIWIIFPLYLYSLGIIFVCAVFMFHFEIWFERNFFVLIPFLLPIAAWIFPPIIVYQILRGKLFAKYTMAVRGLSIVAILALGLILAFFIQTGIYLVLIFFGHITT